MTWRIFLVNVVLACLKTLRKLMKYWCYCGLPNELNDSIIMKCKVNNNTTNCCKTKQAEVLIANGISCNVNDREAKLSNN